MEINSEKTFIDRLIVVDDEEDIRLLLRDTLQDHYDLSVQEGGEDAIACVRQSLEMNKPFSVAIMDLNMPGMDGITTAMKIRELDERIHLILMAGESRNILETLDESLKNNLILVRKPFAIYDVFMLTQYLCKTWQMARTLEVRSAELSTKVHQSESIRATIKPSLKQPWIVS